MWFKSADKPEDVLSRAKRGDERSFAELVRGHQSMVYSIAWNFLRNHAVAEELAQDVFLHLHRSVGEIETPAHLVSWLRRVASHRCIDQGRRSRFRPRVGLEDAPEPVARRDSADPMLSAHLGRLVAGLPERSRMVVILRYQEDLDPQEIAGMLGLRIGTVKSVLHRALLLLRTKMEKTQAAAEQSRRGVAQ